MNWNWQQDDWPHFRYDLNMTRELEKEFLLSSGEMFGAFSHLGDDDQNQLRIQLLSDEALLTSKIEGEILDRDSLQSSLQRQFEIKALPRKISAAEQGVSQLLVDIHQNYAAKLTQKRLMNWHEALMQGRSDLRVGAYRKGCDAMQIVSGPIHQPTVHYEAPPSARLPLEMRQFLSWFDDSLKSLPALARSAIAHLYFESLHPFEDGNGRIGRALSELSLSQSLQQPLLVSLSQTIEANRKHYYEQLARSSRSNEIGDWLLYFSETILQAQKLSIQKVHFLVSKTKFLDRFGKQLNPRQEKAVLRIFREGLDGFEGGLSSANYRSITAASPATATRDLQQLVTIGAFLNTGELKHTRYHINFGS